ncbi:TetR/AcrR family transcriptional regulator [Kocuria atrinae]|uniref:TetR/AcrR family transcriptional regulator n=1 Tax=Kocuria atrinae TaxID=592377 RepID=UPI0002F0CC44|nr:TetR/AcrR family transcriptional regulator [Kocuria atrinae]
MAAPRAKRRIELITAARDAVATHGASISMEEIATACGTSKSVFYRYFKDKSGVQAAVGEYFVSRMRTRMVAAAHEADSFAATVHALVKEYLKSVEASADVYRFVVTAPADGDSAIEQFLDSVCHLLMDQHIRHRGEQAMPQALLQCWAASTVGMVRGAGEAWLALPDTDDKPDRTTMSQLITDWAVQAYGLTRTPRSPQTKPLLRQPLRSHDDCNYSTPVQPAHPADGTGVRGRRTAHAHRCGRSG